MCWSLADYLIDGVALKQMVSTVIMLVILAALSFFLSRDSNRLLIQVSKRSILIAFTDLYLFFCVVKKSCLCGTRCTSGHKHGYRSVIQTLYPWVSLVLVL